MGNSYAQTLDDFESISFEQFKNIEISPRKMIIHVLSSSKKDCIGWVESLTLKSFPENTY